MAILAAVRTPTVIVWFKRDLRIEDHAALVEALKWGTVLPLYILEQELWSQPDMSHRHYQFLQDAIAELDRSLTALGQKLVIKVGRAVDVLEKLHQRHNVKALYAHQETWNHWTYVRDREVRRWCTSHEIAWHEPVQNGVIRCLDTRDGWSARWYHLMKQPVFSAPKRLRPIDETSDALPTPAALGLYQDHCVDRQKGGRVEGLKLLHEFLNIRGAGYTKEMSSPVTAFQSCSRLSTHLAFGTLSIREVFQASEQRKQALRRSSEKGSWRSAMQSFSGRLRWHCHFIQKLEDQPSIEYQNMHPDYDGLRPQDGDDTYFQAWKTGNTGYPMVDACMRALIATGWLNFRMRAMLMSFASYHLWLPWQKPALHLARLFTDYEPGIHYSQVQMQSGTTGINAIRIYNPIKQGIDQDPEGIFLRQWLPELRDMSTSLIHMPWLARSEMNDYPLPIVDEKTARKAAAEKIYSLRKNNKAHQNTAREIVRKHGSRRSGRSGRAGKKTANDHPQGELFR